METIHSQSSSSVSRNSAASPTPALLKTMSTLSTASPNSRTCSRSATSTRRATTSRPRSRALASVCARPTSSTSQIAMSAPRRAASSAVARPMPLPAPVTTTTRPCRLVVSIGGTPDRPAMDLQPDARLAVGADAPAIAHAVDDLQAALTGARDVARDRRRLEAGATVADLHPDALIVDQQLEFDEAASGGVRVDHRVADQL